MIDTTISRFTNWLINHQLVARENRTLAFTMISFIAYSVLLTVALNVIVMLTGFSSMLIFGIFIIGYILYLIANLKGRG